MANWIAKHHLLLVAVALILAVPASARRGPVHLRFYMHDVAGGPGQTAMLLVKGPGPPRSYPYPGERHFGDTTVIDDLLTEGPSLDSKAVGRARGTYILASLDDPVLLVSITVLLTEGPYKGSTIVVSGHDNVSEEVRELAVLGGTGQLRRATGHVIWRTAEVVSGGVVLELDVYATVPASAAPARRHYWSVASNRSMPADS